jgi:hypothetical protein
VDKRNAILVNEANPTGWVNRTAEKEKLAAQGEEWRSDVYVFFYDLLEGV